MSTPPRQISLEDYKKVDPPVVDAVLEESITTLPYGSFPAGSQAKIDKIVHKYYTEDGPNQLPHISRDIRQGYLFCRFRHRPMNIKEYAAIMLHDVAKNTNEDDHGIVGARIVKQELNGILQPDEIEEVCAAIAEHNILEGPASSETSDLLRSADANIPSIGWCGRKWTEKYMAKGLSKEDALKKALEFFQAGYATLRTSKFPPRLWSSKYARVIKDLEEVIKTLTIDDIDRAINAYLTQYSAQSSFEEYSQAIDRSAYFVMTDFPLGAFCDAVYEEYNTNRVANLVEAIGLQNGNVYERTVMCHNFFLPEIVYLLEKLEFPPRLSDYILKNSWMGKIRGYDAPDFSALNGGMPTVNFLPLQKDFIGNYGRLKSENNLRGRELAFDPGLGKTMTALGTMEAYKKVKIIILCPKNTMNETWKHHIDTYVNPDRNSNFVYSTPYTASDRKRAQAARYEIYNYDALPYVLENFKNGFYKENVGLIVDEAHNFLRMDAERTKMLCELAKGLPQDSLDILLLTGTPIKCRGAEMIPMMTVLDPLFDEDAALRFKKAFGNNQLVADILNNRLNRMMTRAKKEDSVALPEKIEQDILVKMSSGNQYTVSKVEEGAQLYAKERYAYHQKMMPTYQKEFYGTLDYFEAVCLPKLGATSQQYYKQYRNDLDDLLALEGKISGPDASALVRSVNTFEKQVLEPALPKEYKDRFRHSKAAVKYLPLKVKGEVLGDYLMRLRIQMTTELMFACDLGYIINHALKKTIVFTSFVATIRACEKYLRQQKFRPVSVYGDTASQLDSLLTQFKTNPKINPLIASLQTLATGATLTEANTVVFLNKPWRSIEYEQASDRVHRIGQDAIVNILSIILDTGKEGNLSTRMEDIMAWSNEQFGSIVDPTDAKEPNPEEQAAIVFSIPTDALFHITDNLRRFLSHEGIDLEVPSEEGFWARSETVRRIVQEAPVIRTPRELINMVQPGDLLLTYIDPSKVDLVSARNYYANSTVEGSSFSSCKLVTYNKTVTGYGVEADSCELAKDTLEHFMEHLAGAMIIRHKKMTPDKAKRIIDFVEGVYKNDRSYNSKGTMNHLYEKYVPWVKPDDSMPTTRKEAMERIYYCTSLPYMAFYFSGLKIEFLSGVTPIFCWPIDYVDSPSFDVLGFWQKDPNRADIRNLDLTRLLPTRQGFFGNAQKAIYAAAGYEIPFDFDQVAMDVSMEEAKPLGGSISSKKAKILEYICRIVDIADPTKTNSAYYKQLIAGMNDKQFDDFMKAIRDGKWTVHLVAPNLIVNLQNENLLKCADALGVEIFHKLWMRDHATGQLYLTDNKYPIIQLPVRRQQQFLDEKMSVPSDDKTIDALTGQVTGDSKASSVTNPEVQILSARGLDNTLREFVSARGGNMAQYAELRRACEENGEVSLSQLDPNSRPRSAVVASIMLRSILLDNNL